jgi:hypothetical protein
MRAAVKSQRDREKKGAAKRWEQPCSGNGSSNEKCRIVGDREEKGAAKGRVQQCLGNKSSNAKPAG